MSFLVEANLANREDIWSLVKRLTSRARNRLAPSSPISPAFLSPCSCSRLVGGGGGWWLWRLGVARMLLTHPAVLQASVSPLVNGRVGTDYADFSSVQDSAPPPKWGTVTAQRLLVSCMGKYGPVSHPVAQDAYQSPRGRYNDAQRMCYSGGQGGEAGL